MSNPLISNIDNFRTELAKHNLSPDDILSDGLIHRFDEAGEKRGKKSAWYVLHEDLDFCAGSFGSWKTDLSEKWCSKSVSTMQPEQRKQYNTRMRLIREQAASELLAVQRLAAEACATLWSSATEANPDNPYLTKKGIKPHGLREFKNTQTLIVPVRDDAGNITSLQFIGQDGSKKFKSGGRKSGCYFSFGGKPLSTVLICEGYATGASLHEATGYPVAVAFDAGNMEAVGKALRAKLPETNLVFCADNDRFTDSGNTGIRKATSAAQSVGGKLVFPVFKSDAGCLTDFNDLHQVEGLEAVKTQIASVLNLDELPDVESFEDVVMRLAGLTPDKYDRVRVAEHKKLGVQLKTLDSAVKSERNKESESNDSPFDEVEPWPDEIDPAALLSEIEATIRRFIICEPETSRAAALWAAMTWFMDVVQVAPLAVITAPEKRCGKSQLLFLLMRTTCKPLPASNITPAALFRSIDKWQPTLLIDEADAFMRENEELRGLLNCGHTRESAFSIRTVGDDHTPTRFNLWGAKALAGIGHLADTLMDRAITLELRRKMPSESVDKLRYAEPELFSVLNRKLARFAIDYSEIISNARPELPTALHDRAQDNWEPLLAIADAAGGVWPEQARKAALRLSGEVEQTQSHGAELLSDIQEVFELKKVARMFSADLTNALCDDSEKSWSTYNRGKPITPKQLSRKLGEYGVISQQIKIFHEGKKGYRLEQFSDAFARYLADTSKNSDFNETSKPANASAGFKVSAEIETYGRETQIETLRASTGAGCFDVSLKNGVLGNPERKNVNSKMTVEI